ncbi:site-specific integrase [Amphritea sp. 2_MG-2023]|uniref:site-specific integrase n=1 Tax=Amphritea TaxID=515417 RepID=UPI001C0740A1|nr:MULTISPECIES: site-specific integrase [Amphritea]MBU2963833.1 site-specific integrase [Amphritea atlantica]MDO6418998.1 site-specific integrase [Amphritea sp. 2_MG-2023]
MSAHTPHLFRRPSGIYYIRLTIPKPVLTKFTRSSRDIRLSLKTTDKAEASTLSCLLRYQFPQILDCINKDRFTNTAINITQFVTLKFKELILKYHLKDKDMSDELSNLILPDIEAAATASQRETVKEARENAVTVTTYSEKRRHVAPSNEIVIEVNGNPVTINHPGNPDLELEQATKILQRFGGGGNGPDNQDTEYPVRFVFDAYIKNKVRTNLKANPQTQSEHVQMLETCVELLGPDTNYYTLTFDDAEALRDKLLTLKDGRARNSATAATIQPSRAKKILDRFKQLAKYAKRKKYNPEDLGEDLEIIFKQSEKSDEDKVYSEEDLQKLFAGYPYSQITLDRARNLFDYHFWLIPVLMYTGARLNEICQLQVSDIKQEVQKAKKGSQEALAPIHYIHIKNEFDEQGNKTQEVKTDSSRRKVPIHKTLIELGFLDFVAKRKREVGPAEQLFEGLYYSQKNKWAKKASDWFNGNGKMKSYREECNIVNPKQKNLHTFRHTFIGAMTDSIGVEVALISRIVGHEISQQTAKYGRKQVSLDRLKAEIDILDYDVDISHLDYDAFVAYKNRKGK